MRNLLTHLLGVTLILGATTSLTGCVVEARGSARTGSSKPAKVKPAKATPAATTKPVQMDTPAPQNFETENGALKLPGPVLFETGKAVLKPESDAVLDVVKNYLDAKPAITLLRIEGHTDNVGVAASNQTLSELRAMAVAQWLIAKGVRCKRLNPVGFGDRKPLASNSTEDGRSQNRRTMFINAELKGKAIGGMPVDGGGTQAGDPCR